MKKIAVVGPPGTGKTTFLTKLYNEKYKDKQSVFITFTTTARDVLRERGVESAHTLHSFVTRLLLEKKLIRPNQIKENAFERLMLKKGFGFDFTDVNSAHPSNAALRAYSYYFNKYPQKTDEEILEVARRELPGAVFTRLEAYVEYVRKTGVIDYVSLLRRALVLLDEIDSEELELHELYHAIIVDEAQDLSRLQYAVIQKLVEKFTFEDADFIMAGDYNQSIYDFQASDHTIFKDFVEDADEVITLSQSYRLPEKVHNFSQFIVKRLGTAVEFKPRQGKGEVRIIKLPRKIMQNQSPALIEELIKIIEANKDKKIFILTRTNAQAHELEKKLYDVGYGTHRIKNAISWFEINEAVYSFKILRYYDHVLVKYVASNDSRAARILSHYSNVIELAEALNDENNKSSEIEEMREIIEYFVEKIDPRPGVLDLEVYLDTMHASKGEEADVVVVLDFLNARVEKELKKGENFEAEARLFYVATTRSREKLYVFTTDSKRSILTYLRT